MPPMDPQMKKQSTKTGGRSTSMMTKPHGDAEFWPLSGNPYFYVVIGKSKRFQLNFPQELSEKLPTTNVLAKVAYREKVWDLLYLGDQTTKRFEIESWGKFMTENNLAAGDACFFELIKGGSNSCVIEFKVQIFRDDFPFELLEKTEGFCENNPIDLD